MFDMTHTIPYIDPKYLNLIKSEYGEQSYVLNTKSDVYSIGVLFWQLSSGFRPFHHEGIPYDMFLGMSIRLGKREEVIEGTPIKYSDLYTGKFFHPIF